MKNHLPRVIFYLAAFLVVATILHPTAYALTVFGIGSHPLLRDNIDNYNNWPYDVKRKCVVEQSRAVLECSKSSHQNWMVHQAIIGKGFYNNKSVSMFYSGYASNFTCEPPEVREVNGFLEDTHFHIHSRLIDTQIKTIENNKSQYSSYICSFVCQSWDCAGKSLEERLAEERLDLKKENIFCVSGIFKEGITPQERESLEEGLVTEEEKKELEMRQRLAEYEINKWWWSFDQLLTGLCKSKGKDCKLYPLYNKETRLKEVIETSDWWIEDPDYYYTGEKLMVYCWYCKCWNLTSFQKKTIGEGDIEKAKRLVEKYGKTEAIKTKIDSLSQSKYTVPYLEGNKANLVIYDGNKELMTIGINFGEEVEIEDGGFRDANIICEAQFDEVNNLETSEELIKLSEEKCKGADFVTSIMLKIRKIFRGII